MERQLRELEVEEGEVEGEEDENNREEEEAYITAQKRREATEEERDAFEREMQGESSLPLPSPHPLSLPTSAHLHTLPFLSAMLSESREGSSRKTRVDGDDIKIPLALLRPAPTQGGGRGEEGRDEGAGVTLRVLRKGAKNKLEASEVECSSSPTEPICSALMYPW